LGDCSKLFFCSCLAHFNGTTIKFMSSPESQQQKLALPALTLLVIGSMVGAGIFLSRARLQAPPAHSAP